MPNLESGAMGLLDPLPRRHGQELSRLLVPMALPKRGLIGQFLFPQSDLGRQNSSFRSWRHHPYPEGMSLVPITV